MSEVKNEINKIESLDSMFKELEDKNKIYEEYKYFEDVVNLIRKVKYFDLEKGNKRFKSVEKMLMGDIVHLMATKYKDVVDFQPQNYIDTLRLKQDKNPKQHISLLHDGKKKLEPIKEYLQKSESPAIVIKSLNDTLYFEREKSVEHVINGGN